MAGQANSESKPDISEKNDGITFWKVVQWLDNYGIYLYAFICLFTILIGFLGFYLSNRWASPLEALYNTFQLFTLKSGNVEYNTTLGWELEIARWLALLFTSLAAIIILFWKVVVRQVQALRLWLRHDHVVICGTGRIGSRLIKEFGKGYHVVVIEQDKSRKTLESFKYSNVIVVYGNAKDAAVLKKAGVQRAKYLIPALGDDSANAEVAIQAHDLVKNRPGDPLQCYVHIIDPMLCDLIKFRELDSEIESSFRVEFFNLYDNGAQIIFNEHQSISEALADADQDVHLLIVGIGTMGESIVLRAAKLWWNKYNDTRGKQLEITIVDKEAEKRVQSMYLRYPKLSKLCKIHCVNYDLDTTNFLETRLLDLTTGKAPLRGIFVTVMDDSIGLSSALLIHQHLRDHEIPIIVRLHSEMGLSSLLSNSNPDPEMANLFAFGFWDRTCTQDLRHGTYEIIAQAIHEEYLHEQLKTEKSGSKATLTPWNKLNDAKKDDNRDPARHLPVKLRASLLGTSKLTDWEAPLFKFEEPCEVIRLAILEHERWCKYKRDHGWQYAKIPQPDFENLKHPDLLPWEQLTPKAKVKDMDAILKLPGVLSRVDLQLYHKDLNELVAIALYKCYPERAQTMAGGGAETPWYQLSMAIKNKYRSQAKVTIKALGNSGYKITGLAKVSPGVSGIAPEDIETLSKAYVEIALINNLSLRGIQTSCVKSWNDMTAEQRKTIEGEVRAWTGMLASSGMDVYNLKKQTETYASELKLLAEIQNSK